MEQTQKSILEKFHLKRKMQDILDANVKRYFQKKVNDDNISKLSLEQNNSVADYLVKQKENFLQAKKNLEGLNIKDIKYTFFRNQMNAVYERFQMLKANIDEFKKEKIEYVTNISDNLVSRGTTYEDRAVLNKIYLGEASLDIDENGSLGFVDESGFLPYDQRPRYISKDYASAGKILDIVTELNKSGAPLGGVKRTLVEQRLKAMLREGGRDTLLSLATDDFIVHGGLGPIPEQLFELENEDVLFDYVVENYMQVFDNAFNTLNSEKIEKAQASVEATQAQELESTNENDLLKI